VDEEHEWAFALLGDVDANPMDVDVVMSERVSHGAHGRKSKGPAQLRAWQARPHQGMHRLKSKATSRGTLTAVAWAGLLSEYTEPVAVIVK
jgi:hypothetical protein